MNRPLLLSIVGVTVSASLALSWVRRGTVPDQLPLLSHLPNTEIVEVVGQTDDENIQDAIDSLNGPGTVLLGAKKYLLEDSISLPSGVRLVGMGSHATGTVLRVGNIGSDQAGIQIGYGSVDVVERASISNLRIVPAPGTTTTQWLGGIHIDNARDTLIQRVHAQGFATQPLVAGGYSPGTPFPEGTWGFGGIAYNSDLYGVGIHVTGSAESSVIESCRFHNVHAGVFMLGVQASNVVRNSTFSGRMNSSVYARATSGAVFIACSFLSEQTYAHFEGVDVLGCTMTLCHIKREPGGSELTWDVILSDDVVGSSFNSVGLSVLGDDSDGDARRLKVQGVHGLASFPASFAAPLQVPAVLGPGQAELSFPIPDDWDRVEDVELEFYFEEHDITGAGTGVTLDVEIRAFLPDGSFESASEEVEITVGQGDIKHSATVPLDWLGPDLESSTSMTVKISRGTHVDDADSEFTVEAAQVRYGSVGLELEPSSKP